MKRISKLFITFLLSAILLLSPMVFSGCGQNGEASSAELNDMLATSAEKFYDAHTDYDNFSDITYHWKNTSTEKTTVTLNYKKNATDETTVEGKFENKTVTETDYSVAIKKGASYYNAQIIVTETVTATEYDLNADETLLSSTSTTRTSDNIRIIDNNDTNNPDTYVLLWETSEKQDDNDATVTKKYAVLSEDTCSDYFSDYVLKYPNKRVRDTFFEVPEFIIFYKSLIDVKKDGDVTLINIGYENMVSVDSYSYEVAKYTIKTKLYYKQNGIWKAENTFKSTSKTASFQQSASFDFTNTAIVDGTYDISEYTNSPSLGNNLYTTLNKIPEMAFFG